MSASWSSFDVWRLTLSLTIEGWQSSSVLPAVTGRSYPQAWSSWGLRDAPVAPWPAAQRRSRTRPARCCSRPAPPLGDKTFVFFCSLDIFRFSDIFSLNRKSKVRQQSFIVANFHCYECMLNYLTCCLFSFWPSNILSLILCTKQEDFYVLA